MLRASLILMLMSSLGLALSAGQVSEVAEGAGKVLDRMPTDLDYAEWGVLVSLVMLTVTVAFIVWSGHRERERMHGQMARQAKDGLDMVSQTLSLLTEHKVALADLSSAVKSDAEQTRENRLLIAKVADIQAGLAESLIKLYELERSRSEREASLERVLRRVEKALGKFHHKEDLD